mgnify:CR=1 FL=1
MNLQTKIPLSKESDNLIDYESEILLLGSCFSENIGRKLDYFKFQNLQNPFGIFFNPKAIETFVSNAINKKEYTEADIFFRNERWHCFEAHSRLNNPSKEVLLNTLNERIEATSNRIWKASHLIITLGTAWVYRFMETKTVVANCHKVPQNQFDKELLSISEITQSLQYLIDLVKFKNANINIILTVSPVRHLKDGFIENTQSKAHLIAAIHQLLASQSDSRGVHYFPSYEIMMDELRDYRFYDSDMVHPNQLAIDYIWERFKEVWISENSLTDMNEVDAIQKGLSHKPFSPNSKAHQAFQDNLQAKINSFQVKFPHISF